MAESVTILNLTKTFSGGVLALNDVSLQIEAGELFFLLGRSGCGKNTLLRAIAGFVTPDQGTIHIGTNDISRLPAHKRDTGMVFQSYALWPHLTIRQNVGFGLEMRGVRKSQIAQKTQEALELVQMVEKANFKPNELSGGQQQRVALARALVVEPRCLLLDEPLSNLDAKLRLDMRQEIRRICKAAGITAIYVTHDQKEALSIADRMAILNQGRVQQTGTPQHIYRKPINAFVAGFIGESNFIPGTVQEKHDNGLTIKTELGMLRSETDLPVAAGSKVTLSIRPEAIIKMDAAHDGKPNQLRATCKQVVYLGESAQYLIDIQGLLLKRHEWNPRNMDHAGTNERVWIHPCDVVVLQESL